MTPAKPPQLLSFVIPVLNERETLRPLCAAIAENAAPCAADFEIIFVDDGSVDGSLEILRALCAENPRVRLIALAVHSGKAAALEAGLLAAKGELIFTLDADLQDDPEEIPNFLQKIAEGNDLVVGWKSQRNDPAGKTLPSHFFNFVVSRVSGLPLHDFNCGFKAMTPVVAQNLTLYGELHRYIPLIAHNNGARIAEIPVRHHPRISGESKYGWERLHRGFLDLLTIIMITRFLKRPLHFFGSIGMISFLLGGAMLVYLAFLWCIGERPIGNRPLLTYGVLLAILGVQLLSIGLLAEMMIHFAHRRAAPAVREKTGFPEKN